MKSENIEVPKEEIKYPCIMESVVGTTVLFTAPGKGTAIYGPFVSCGTFSEHWAMEDFVRSTSKFVLSND